MRHLATLATVVACLATLTATAAAEQHTTLDTTPLAKALDRHVPATCKAPAFRGFSAKVWDTDRWERGQPKAATIRTQRRRLRCAGPGHRKAMRHRWRSDKRAYYRHRSAQKAEAEYVAALTPPGIEYLAALRACESGGDYSINTGNGFFGAYQFDEGTWHSVGGSGYAHEAPPREQDERAAALYRSRGGHPWPNCP